LKERFEGNLFEKAEMMWEPHLCNAFGEVFFTNPKLVEQQFTSLSNQFFIAVYCMSKYLTPIFQTNVSAKT